MYLHQLHPDIQCTREPGKVVCVGRNYAEHAKELNNAVEASPLLFLKPATAMVSMAPGFSIPTQLGEVHHELEMAILIGQPLVAVKSSEIEAAIVGVGLAIDLTLRDLQTTLKQKAHPWERAKAFDGACPLSAFISPAGLNLQAQELTLVRNGEVQQQGNTRDMMFPIHELIAEMSHCFTLLPGDVVLTGTPAGVGPLAAGDRLTMKLGDVLEVNSLVSGR